MLVYCIMKNFFFPYVYKCSFLRAHYIAEAFIPSMSPWQHYTTVGPDAIVADNMQRAVQSSEI